MKYVSTFISVGGIRTWMCFLFPPLSFFPISVWYKNQVANSLALFNTSCWLSKLPPIKVKHKKNCCVKCICGIDLTCILMTDAWYNCHKVEAHHKTKLENDWTHFVCHIQYRSIRSTRYTGKTYLLTKKKTSSALLCSAFNK